MLDEVGWKVRIMVMLVMLVLVLNAAVDIVVVTNQQLRYSVAWDWEKDMLDRLGRKVRMMVMLVMLVLVLNAAVDIAAATDHYSSGEPCYKNIARIANLPYGQSQLYLKSAFIKRKALIKKMKKN